MVKSILFSELPISATREGDTIVAYRNGRVVRIPVPSAGVDVGGLATVATSGKYSDLSGLPTLGTAASKADSYFATADQGSKGVSAYLWGNHASAGYALASSVTQALAQKVDKQTGYGLSQQNFTLEEKQKLAGLESSRYKGLFSTLGALQSGVTAPSAGDYGDVDAGSGSDVQRYIWDASDQKWIEQSGAVSPVTAAQVKTLYESNPNTNAFTNQQKADLESVFSWGDHRMQGYVVTTDARLSNAREWTATVISQPEAEAGTSTTARKWTAQRVRQAVLAWWSSTGNQTKLDGIEVGATKNATDAQLRDRSTHTGEQPLSTITGLESSLDSKVDLTDSRLTNAREWTASDVTQAEAEAGTATTARKWTAQRVRQAILGWWSSSLDKTKLDGIASGATKNATDAQLRNRTTHTGEQPISTVTGLQSALDSKVSNEDARLSNSREWTASVVSQAEAEAGTSTTARKWTAQRVRQAISAWFLAVSGTLGRTILGRNTAAEVRSDLGLGTAATLNSGFSGGLVATSAKTAESVFYSGTSSAPRVTYSFGETAGGWARGILNANLAGDTQRYGGFWFGLLGSASNYSRGVIGFGNDSNWWQTNHQISLYPSKDPTVGVSNTIFHMGNLLKSTGVDDEFPMSQKAVTDALATKASTSTQVIAGDGLSGGGTLEADRTLSVKYGTTAGTAAQGNDARLSNAREWTGAEVSQAEAEAGTAATARKWTSQRVRQNVAAYTYSREEVDSLVAGATTGSNVWQTATSALTKNVFHKISFTTVRTLLLPANPTENDYVAILKTGGSTVGSQLDRNGKTIMGLAEDMTIDREISYLRLDYVSGSWRIAS